MDRQPPLWVVRGVLVFLSGLEGVFDRCLRPDLTGPDVDAASGAERVAFEDASQFLEVDWQGPQHRRRATAKQSIKLVSQLIVPVPASLAERNNEIASQLGRSVDTLHDGSNETVTAQLERVIVGADAPEQVDDSRSVATVDSPLQGRALLLGVHLALRSLALRRPSRGPSDPGA